MNTLFNNKWFVAVCTACVGLLALFLIVLSVNSIKENRFIGQEGKQPAIITVSGVGEVVAVSDIATLSFSVSKEGKTTKEAQDALNASLTKTLEYLKSQKIEDADVKSEYGGVNPKYSTIMCITYPCPQDQKIIGYTASQSINVKIRDVDTANDIRTGLADSGITNISGPDFSIDDEEGLKDEARSEAILNAQEKAEILALQLGVKLGKIVSFSDSVGGMPYPVMYDSRSMMKTEMASAPVLPKGENKIISNVSITYEIR